MKDVKESLQRMKNMMRGAAERVERAINPPLTDAARPVDIRQAIIEAIEERVQPVGGGRRVLPDRFVKVRVLAHDPAQERALQTALQDVRAIAVARLRELACEVDPAFQIDVTYARKRSAAWPADCPFQIEFEAAPPMTPAPQQPLLRLTILKGRATAGDYELREPVVRVGRSESPVDSTGRPRHNHVAFVEDGDATSATVGRGHCEIRYQPNTRQYRVYDERSANGTRIVRNGEIIPVPAQDPYGVSLASGDELQFGSASARVEIRDA